MPKKSKALTFYPPQQRQIFWIDVGDHLPDDETTVLGYLGNGEIELVAHDGSLAEKSEDCWYRAGTLGDPVKVWFWADLPELPDIASWVKKGGAK